MSCGSSFCSVSTPQPPLTGGYTPTAKNMDMLRRYKRGESIGFTGRSSLRAKGLLPRESAEYKGMYVLGPKYSGTGTEKVLSRPSLAVRLPARVASQPSFKTKKGKKPKPRQGSHKLHSRSKTRRQRLPRRR
jgi:hypothetical protein